MLRVKKETLGSLTDSSINVGIATGHFKNNGTEFSERLRGGGVAVYVKVCRLEIFNFYYQLN